MPAENYFYALGCVLAAEVPERYYANGLSLEMQNVLNSSPMQIERDGNHHKANEQQKRWIENDTGNQSCDQDISMCQGWNPKDQRWNRFEIKNWSHCGDKNQGKRK